MGCLGFIQAVIAGVSPAYQFRLRLVVGTWAGAGGLLAPAAAIVQVDDLPVEGEELDDIELADEFFFGCRKGGPGGRKTGAFARLFCPVTMGGQVCHLLSVFDEYAHSANCDGHDNIRLAREPLYGVHPISNGVNPALPLPAPDLRWSGSGAYLAPPALRKRSAASPQRLRAHL